MQIIVVKPNKAPYATEISGDLKSMQALVGGYIEAIYPFEDEVALVCNEEGKIIGLPPNRRLYDSDNTLLDTICGDFFLCYAPSNSEDFESIPESLLQKYINMFSKEGVVL